MICNSFSRRAELPNKFRVIMFYKRPATSLGQHKAVYASIVARLEENGFTAKSVKLDDQCKSGVHSFYLPCTNGGRSDWAFFRAYGTKTRDIERCAIDPVTYGRTAILAPPVPTVRIDSRATSSASREQIDAATAHLRSLKTERHEAVFDAAMTLCRLGLSRSEVEIELRRAVGNEPKMRRKVSGVLQYLSQKGWFSDLGRGGLFVGGRRAVLKPILCPVKLLAIAVTKNG